MPRLSSHARQLTRGLTLVTALLVGALWAEGAVQPIEPSQEPEKAVSCTMAGASSERAGGHQEILLLDGPRVAADKRQPGPDAGSTPPVCPLHPAQKQSPPPVRP